MMQAIYAKNPKAFIRGDIDKIKRGVVLQLPSHKDLLGLNTVAKKIEFKGTTPKVVENSLAKNQYKVVKGDSLSKITKKFNAFSSKNKSKLKVGVTLQIPSLDVNKAPETVSEIKPVTVSLTNNQSAKVSAESNQKEAVVAASPEIITDEVKSPDTKSLDSLALSSLKLSTTNKAQIEKTADKVLSENEYRVKAGDTLTTITKEIGYPNVSFTRMMKAIYSENTHAFEKNNITKLKVGSVVVLPELSTLNISEASSSPKDATTEKPVAAEEIKPQIGDTKNTDANTVALDTSNLEKRIRELRNELDQAKAGLAKMKTELDTKDAVIFDKDSQLVDLKSSLIKLKISQTESLENEELIPESSVEDQKKILKKRKILRKSYFEETRLDTDPEIYHEPVDEFNQKSSTDTDNPEEESEEIEHCEHLVTELFSDLNSSASSKTEVSIGDNEWLGIEKICDDYIESHSEHSKETNTDVSKLEKLTQLKSR
ncbi:hypothetical protein GQR58_023573 [Nymphon striatum]|nr:hypothetical protein GQR58_023573 [Nymphon striatum]KAG1657080.1 hypothetical protein GQR58_023573 [Nymphon striatum]